MAQAQEKQSFSPPPAVAEVFRRLLLAAMKLIYADKKVTSQILEMVKSGGDPVNGIVNTAKTIVGQVASKAKGVDKGVVERITIPVAALIAELAVKAGVAEDSPDLMKQVVAALSGGTDEPEAQDAPQEEQAEAPTGGGMIAGQMQGA